MAQNYECILLMDPELSDEAVRGYLDQFSEIITDDNGEVVHVQTWGRRHMEYEIAGTSEAVYGILYFRMGAKAGAVIAEFERRVRINDELLRAMSVKVPELKILELPKPGKAEAQKAAPSPVSADAVAAQPSAEAGELAEAISSEPAAEKPEPAEEKPDEEKPDEEKPEAAEEKPDEEKPEAADEKPEAVEEKPEAAEEKPEAAEEKPAEEKPEADEEKPAEERFEAPATTESDQPAPGKPDSDE